MIHLIYYLSFIKIIPTTKRPFQSHSVHQIHVLYYTTSLFSCCVPSSQRSGATNKLPEAVAPPLKFSQFLILRPAREGARDPRDHQYFVVHLPAIWDPNPPYFRSKSLTCNSHTDMGISSRLSITILISLFWTFNFHGSSVKRGTECPSTVEPDKFSSFSWF